MIDKIKEYISEAQGFSSQDPAELEAFRIKFLGSKGLLKELFAEFKNVPNEQKKEFGQVINLLKTSAEDKVKSIQEALESKEESKGFYGDLTRAAEPVLIGSRHPISIVKNQIIDIFSTIGFNVSEGPEIEDDWHNFTALNIPESHPARAMHDTFYFPDRDGEGRAMLLRTHTSPVQIRTMVSQKPPIRIIAPGRTYRKDSDQTHTPMFHQVEGLVIDRGIHMGHLKWTLETFVGRFFETSDVVTRFRPHHFPFTEPSAELDVQCDRTGGELKVGQGQSWLEVLGCGMVHPNVIRNCGLDPDEWQGFAFGMGVDRLAMLKYGVPDLRDMFASDVRWLAHYGFSAFAAPNAAGGLS